LLEGVCEGGGGLDRKEIGNWALSGGLLGKLGGICSKFGYQAIGPLPGQALCQPCS